MSESLVQDIRRIAQEEGADPDLAVRVAKQESGFRQDATSRAGARGIMQLMPETARELGVDINDPMQNIRGGTRYLARQQRAFGSPELALAAYNAGPGRVREFLRTGRELPRETQNYVQALTGAGISPDIVGVDYVDRSGNIIVPGGEGRRRLQPGEELLSAEERGPLQFTQAELEGVPPSMREDFQRAARLRGELAEAGERVAGMTGRLEEEKARGQAGLAETAAQTQRRAFERYQSERKMPTEFVPTQETAGDLSALFGLLGVFGTLIGGGGKQNAINAMSAMTGMMNGWRQGRQDLYNRERQIFETNMKQLEQRNNELRRDLQASLEIAKTDMDAGLARLRVSEAVMRSPILMEQAKSGRISALLESGNELMRLKAEMEKHKRTLDAEAARRQATQDQNVQQFLRSNGSPTQSIYADTGVLMPRQEAEKVVTAQRAIGEGLSIIDEVARHPEVMGRSGQVRGFFERYISSALDALNNNRPPPDPNAMSGAEGRLSQAEQNALIFAKRYAAYLVNYERALAGGARGFTVSFQQRFNRLMAQEQFSAQGLMDLMKDHVNELAVGSAPAGIPQLNFDGMIRTGILEHNRLSGPERQGSAQRGFDLAFNPQVREIYAKLRQQNQPYDPLQYEYRIGPNGNVQSRRRER
jgi:hypothetical protein